MTQLNRFQRLVADNYAAGDYSWLDNQREAKADASLLGDTLLTFLMRELSDDCQDDPNEALRRLTAARLDLQELERIFFSSASGLWPEGPPQDITT